MKPAKKWLKVIDDAVDSYLTRGDLLSLEFVVRQIQDDARTDSPTNVGLLLEYHEQQKEWWRTNTNDPHNIGTALYTMHCDMVNIYDAIVSGDARKNYKHNKKVSI